MSCMDLTRMRGYQYSSPSNGRQTSCPIRGKILCNCVEREFCGFRKLEAFQVLIRTFICRVDLALKHVLQQHLDLLGTWRENVETWVGLCFVHIGKWFTRLHVTPDTFSMRSDFKIPQNVPPGMFPNIYDLQLGSGVRFIVVLPYFVTTYITSHNHLDIKR